MRIVRLVLSSNRRIVLIRESDQFLFLLVLYFVNLKVSVGLILAEASGMWVTIPIDLSTSCHLSYVSLVSFTLVESPLFLVKFLLLP